MIVFDIGYSEIQSVNVKLIKIGELQLLIQEISSADNFISIVYSSRLVQIFYQIVKPVFELSVRKRFVCLSHIDPL